MNPDTTPTPRWEIKISDEDGITPYLWDNRKYDNYDLGSLCRILNEYEEKTNEVERLREELQDIKDGMKFIMDEKCAESEVHCGCVPLLKISFKEAEQEAARLRGLLKDHATFLRKNGFDRQADDLVRFAPAPEEPVTEGTRIADEARDACNSLTDEDRKRYATLAEDVLNLHKPDKEPTAPPVVLNHQIKENTVSLNEWRELLPEEEIHTGDQVQAKHHDKVHGVWYDVFPYEVGAMPMPIDHEAFRYRTRRPLPKQEEKDPDDLHAWMRLQEHINREVAVDLQRLFDEIQTLKAKKSQSPNLS